MTDDLVARLREGFKPLPPGTHTISFSGRTILHEAADRIAELEADVEAMRTNTILIRHAAGQEEHALHNIINSIKAERDRLREALEFYADPETYFGVAFMADRPCGDFVEDFEELTGELGHPDGGSWEKPGKRARAALGGGK